MSEKLKELREKQEDILAKARTKLDELDADGIDEARTAEIEAEYDKMMKDFDAYGKKAEREEDAIRKENMLLEAEEQLREIDRERRPVEDRQVDGDVEDTEERTDAEVQEDAYRSFISYGFGGMTNEERSIVRANPNQLRDLIAGENRPEGRAQATSPDSAGGALIPEGFLNRLIESMVDYGPMNDMNIVDKLVTGSGNALPVPTVNDTSNKGRRISENTQVTATDISFSSKTLNAYKYSSDLVLVSSELLQDSALDTESIVRRLLAERIGRIFNQEFTLGTGSDQPEGIVTASTLGVTAASGSTIAFDEMFDLEHSVDPAYRKSAKVRWMFNDTTLKVLRKLKDGDGNYLWQMGNVKDGTPATILDHPYSINQDMDSIGDSSPGSDNRPIIFGDFGKFTVRMVRTFAVKRLAERYADYDQVGFVGFTRADSIMLDTAAVKHMAMPA